MMPAAGKLVLLRHGQSVWNRDNRFTGWRDIALSERGKQEARSAARALAISGALYDVAFTSILRRAIGTLYLVLAENKRMWIPALTDWRLNERHYGALQGWKKDDAARHYGEEQILRWRRGYEDVPPPEETDATAEDAEGIAPNDGRYDGIDIPRTESLAQVEPRVWQFFQQRAAPKLLAGKRVLIVAHGNSLRALIKQLEGLSAADIAKVNIATATPMVYSLDARLRPLAKEVLAVSPE